MSRYIDADALLDEARSFSRTVLYGKNLCFQEDAVMMKRLVEIVNTLAREDFGDAVPVVHGHWESINDYYHMCSCCGKGISGYFGKPPEESVALYAKYCSNCGAKMDEVTE